MNKTTTFSLKKRLLTTFFFAFFGFSVAFAQSSPLYFPPLTGTTWQTVSPTSLGWCADKLDSVRTFLGDRHTKACIILKDGKIAAEWYFGSFTQDSLHYWASASKTMTGLLVGVAQREGILNLNDTTSRFLGAGWTSLPPAKERLITVKNNLTMTTGLDDNVPDDNCMTPACLIYKADAGTRWSYHNAPYRLLQDVVAAASGVSYQQYTTTKLKQKTGMNGLWYDYIYYSNARSMARFGLLLLNKGNWNTTPVLGDTAYFRQMVNTSNPHNLSYGYLTWLNGKASCMLPKSQFVFPQAIIPSAPADMFCALGKNDQKIYVVPTQNLVVIRLGDAATATALALSTFDEPLWQKINQVFCTTATDNTTENPIDIAVFPNPVTHVLTLKTTEKIKKMQVYDALGQAIYAYDGEMTSIDIKNWQNGIYFIDILTENGIKRLKFVKN